MSRQLKAKLKEQRKRLLDLTGRNKLLNYKHAAPNSRSKRQSFLRIVDEIPEFIIERLESEKSFQLILKPKEREYEVDLKLLSQVEALSKAHKDNKIQVLEESEIFKPTCEKLRSDNRLSNQERGINVLQIAIGFLSWFESKGISKEDERLSPLLLYPVEITRSRSSTGYEYYIESTGEDLKINTTLWRKLNESEGITLPELELEDDGSPKIKKLFENIIALLAKRNSKDNRADWGLKSWSTVGLFSFSNISIYNDLDFENWDGNPLEDKEVLKSFIQGTPCGSIESMGSLETYQDSEESNLSITEAPQLIADADSTQYAVIKKALEDKSLVVQGPPGTGKSQTITNIIAALLGKGKSVLFAADKLAALEVVNNRLSDKGMDQFCLEIHSTGTSKIKIIEAIKQRLESDSEGFPERSHKENFQKLKQLRKSLNEHSDVLNKLHQLDHGETNLHDLMWSQINIDLESSSEKEKDTYKKASLLDVDQIPKASADLLSETLNSLANKTKELEELGLVDVISTDGIPDTETNLSRLISEASKILSDLNELLDDFDSAPLGWQEIKEINKEEIIDQIRQSEKLVTGYSINPNIPLNNNNLDELSEVLEGTIERESAQSGLEPWTNGFLNDEEKFNSVNECTEKILEAYSTDHEYINSVEQCLTALQESAILLKDITRTISRKEEALPTICTVDLLVHAIEAKECISVDSIEAINLILRQADSSDSIQECFASIKEIQKTTYLSSKLKKLGLDPFKVCSLGAETFKSAEEAIRSASFLGCLFDKEVKAAKNLWKQCSEIGAKKPFKLNALGKIYVFAKEYATRVSIEETSIDVQGFDIEQLKDLSQKIVLDERLINTLIAYKNKYERNGISHKNSEKLLQVCSAFVKDKSLSTAQKLKETSITKIMDMSIENAQPYISKISSTIRTKLSLLGNEIRGHLIKLNWNKLDDLSEDLGNFRVSANALALTLEKVDIFQSEGLQFSLSSSQIEDLLKHLNDMNIGEWTKEVKISLETEGVAAAITNLKSIESCKEKHSNFISNMKREPICSFLDSDKANHDLLEPNYVKTKLAILDRIKDNQSDVLQVLRETKRITSSGFKNGLSEIIQLSNESNIKASKLYRYALLSGQSSQLSLEEKISTFSGKALNSSKELFCNIDQEFISSTSKYLCHSLSKSTESCLLPGNSYGSPKSFTEGPLIQHEVKKQKRHLPMRLMLRQAFESISRLKPCWMMSPASAAELLPKQTDIFDVLIIDEASQMKPEKAFSLIARCKQLIIVGDRNQLPPTNFFQKQDSQKEDEDIEIEDNESILELADKVISNNGCSLGWHYRSRHQSLIAFSNHYFYDDSLTIFASNSVGSEVKYHCVENPNYRGGVNLPEVMETIIALKQQIKEAPDKSILIATMNEAQTSELKIALEKELTQDSDLEAFTARHKGTLDELVVKNLENVQGDERDVVIISTVYGPNAEGRVMQNFGPINKEAGWRRLNVLFTRAKHRVILVSSLKPADINVTPKSSRGVKALKDYLSYAQTGKITDIGIKTSGDVESPFEEAVFNALKARGYSLDLQVGVGAYRIDMAIRDPEDPYKYLMAIECDGAAYHSSYSARSRDRLRQQVLEGLGWKVYRIWSTDWFRNPNDELSKLEEEIKRLKVST